MKKLHWLMMIVAFVAISAEVFADTAKKLNRPNIVFILTDDQKWDAMGFMNHYPFLKTPNMDRIRKEGVHFKNSFTTFSMCAPARAAILTGTYPQVNGVIGNVYGREYNPEKTPSFPQILQENGYRTAMIGKWHMDHSNAPRKGFDHWVSFSGQGRYTGNNLNIDGEIVKNDGYITDELTQFALNFIESNAEQSFCLYLSHKAVHQPFTPAKRHSDLYTGEKVPMKPNFKDNLVDKPEWQRTQKGRDALYRLRGNIEYTAPAKKAPRPYNSENGCHPSTKEYLRSIAAVDEGIGRIYDVLEEKGLLKNTIIAFAGDNGYLLGEHQRGDKRVHYNESMRFPLIMRLPGEIPAKSTVEEMVLNIDIAPTLLDFAGVQAPEIMQGKSCVPLFKDKDNTPWREKFLFTYWRDLIPVIPRITAVRTERYVYTTYPDIDDIDELYDLKNDPYEMRNLAVLPEYADLKQEMQQKLEEVKKETKYTDKVPRPRPEPQWRAKEGIICDVSFDKGNGLEVKDASSYANHPTVKGGKLVKGLNGDAFEFDGSSTLTFPWHRDVKPDEGSYVIETLVKCRKDGVISAQGNKHRGLMIYVEDGRPGVVMRESGYRLQFIDSKKSLTDEWAHIVFQFKNFHNEMSLWVNGELVDTQMVWWPLHGVHRGVGGVTIGADPSGKIDDKEISPLKFEGKMEYFKIFNQADVSDIVRNAKKLGLASK